jgi:hypothetical protein
LCSSPASRTRGPHSCWQTWRNRRAYPSEKRGRGVVGQGGLCP